MSGYGDQEPGLDLSNHREVDVGYTRRDIFRAARAHAEDPTLTNTATMLHAVGVNLLDRNLEGVMHGKKPTVLQQILLTRRALERSREPDELAQVSSIAIAMLAGGAALFFIQSKDPNLS